MKEVLNTVRLENGVRVVYQYIPSSISCCGVYLDVGSRDEGVKNEGVAHLIEHLLFKGTNNRDYLEIINYIENIGGDFNAYTSKEETCLYVTLVNEYLERAIDVLSDVIYNSKFPKSEIKKEVEIVIDEINSYKDSPSELIFDDFEENIFQGNSLGHNILGNENAINCLTKKDIKTFYSENYTNDRLIVSYVGGVAFEEFLNIVKKYFISTSNKAFVNNNRTKINELKQISKIDDKSLFQSHFMLGTYAYGILDSNRIVTVLLNNILGGNSFNSILNLKLREENGLTYNIESNYTSYSDTGLFSVYFGTDISKVNQCLDIIKKEFDILLKQGLSEEKLYLAKTQLCGQLALSVDSKTSLMVSNAKSYLYLNKIETLPEIVENINSITNEQIIEVAHKILNFDNISFLQYK